MISINEQSTFLQAPKQAMNPNLSIEFARYWRPQLEGLLRNYDEEEVIQFIRNRIRADKYDTKNTELRFQSLYRLDEYFWKSTVPAMLRSVTTIELEDMDFLTPEISREVHVSCQQVYLIMCHGFFHTLPQQLYEEGGLNFSQLFEEDAAGHNLARLKFFVSYFTIASEKLKELRNTNMTVRRGKLFYPNKKFTDYKQSVEKVLSSDFRVKNERWEPNKHPNGISLQFINQQCLGKGVFSSSSGISFHDASILCHPETLLARLICPGISESEFIYVSDVGRYSIAKQIFEGGEYGWGSATRRDFSFNRFMYIKRPKHLEELKITELKVWISTLQAVFRLAQQMDIDLNSQSIGDRQLDWFVLWIAASGSTKKQNIYLQVNCDELRQELLKRKVTIQDALDMLRKVVQFRKKTNIPISMTDYVLDFYLN